MPLNPVTLSGSVPAYALPQPHHKKHWGVLALAFGILGTGAALLIPLIGIVFGIASMVLVTASFKLTPSLLRIAAISISILSLLVGLGMWVHAVEHDTRLHSATQAGTTNGVATISVTTPCYTVAFNNQLNVNNANGSCSMNAYNNSDFQDSSDVFRVVASQTSLQALGFDAYAKQAITQDMTKNLTGFTVTNQASNLFAGSPAYYISAYNSASNISFIEEAILHISSSTKNADNLFVIVHAVNGQSASLTTVQKTWQWND
jgi:hypothetical protein